MATYRANYVPGNWVLVAGPHLLVLLEPDLRRAAPKIERIWSDVQTATTVDELVGSLVQWGPEASAAAIFQIDKGLRLTYRGQATILDANSGAVLADGAGSPIWRTVEPATRYLQVNLGSDAFGAQRVPLLMGIVGVSNFTVDARLGATTPRNRPGDTTPEGIGQAALEATDAPGDVLDRFGLGGLLGIAQPLAGWEVPASMPEPSPPAPAEPGLDLPAPGIPRPADAPDVPRAEPPSFVRPEPAWPPIEPLTPAGFAVPPAVAAEPPSSASPLVTASEAAWMAAMEALPARSRGASAPVVGTAPAAADSLFTRPVDFDVPAAAPSTGATGRPGSADTWMTRAFAPSTAPTPPTPEAAPEGPPAIELPPEGDPFAGLGLELTPPAEAAPAPAPAPAPAQAFTLSDIEQATARLLAQLEQPLIADWTVDPAEAGPAAVPAGPPVPTPETIAPPVAPAAAAAPPTAPSSPGATVLLSFGDGLEVPVDGVVIIGRSPSGDEAERAHLVKISNATHGLSRSHARIEPVLGGGFRVTDLHSTNGTAVQEPGAAAVMVSADAPVVVPVGTVVKLGGSVEAQLVAR